MRRRDQFERREDQLRYRAEMATGLHYNNSVAPAMLKLSRLDWSQYWPVVNSNGLLTGDIVSGEDGFYNVADMAMIPEWELTPEQLSDAEESGYANV